jgi:hypothetical protein
MAGDNKLQLIFVINGEDVPVTLNDHSPLHVGVTDALRQSENSSRDAQQWELRDSKGVLIDIGRTSLDYRFPSGTRLFLSLKVGAGGGGFIAAVSGFFRSS